MSARRRSTSERGLEHRGESTFAELHDVCSALAELFARGLPLNGIGFLSIAAEKWQRRAVDVNPLVTVRNRAGSAAAGSHQGGTGRLTSTARLA